MADLVYTVTGQVIARETSVGIGGLRIQTLDSDIRRDRVLGETKTDENGRFNATIDLRQFDYQTPPDLFFKVFRGETLLESTESSVLWNANTAENVTIRIRTGKERPAGRDRVTSDQVFKAVDFFQKSDFKGVYNEYKSRTSTTLGFVADMFINTFTNVDMEPVRVKGTPQKDILNQDVDVARRNLAAKNVGVREVVPYKPGLDAASIKSIDVIPKDLKAGSEVRLYEEEGKVRYYSVVKGAATSTDVNEKFEAQAVEMNRLKEELQATRETVSMKDERIGALEKQIEGMNKDQKEMNTVLKSDAFARLIKEMQKPTPPVRGMKKTK
jgi:hypothetical protein